MAYEAHPMVFADKKVTAISPGASEYGHLFGGESCVCSGRRIHRLFEINFDDPAVPCVPSLQGRVELFYCFDFRENLIGYLPSNRNDFFFDELDNNTSQHEEFPTENYPFVFPLQEVRVTKLPYNSASPSDAIAFAGVFGIDDLAPQDRESVLQQERFDYELVNGEPPENEAGLIKSLSGPLLQEVPSGICLNPECACFRTGEKLLPFCVVPSQPVHQFWLFGADQQNVQVVFEVCVSCGTVVASNQAG